MGLPAAKQGDQVVGTDMHLVLVPVAGAVVPMLLPHPFAGRLSAGLSTDVLICGQPAAVVGSTADNGPPHVPMAPGVSFQRPPANRATVLQGSVTVTINGKFAARTGDPATTCNDPADLPAGTVVVTSGTVLIG